jgi:tetratricopeptide (TPR) repeat protein
LNPTESSTAASDWEKRVAELWRQIDSYDALTFSAALDTLLDALPATSPIALFEKAAALDSFGEPEGAVALYRAALAAQIGGERRRRAVIQLASSLRNLGQADEALALLSTELAGDADHLSGAVRAFLALVLADLGREREALALALTALSEYLPRYNRSLARYAAALG